MYTNSYIIKVITPTETMVFKSMYECAKHFGTSVPIIKSRIDNVPMKPWTKKLFPEDVRFEAVMTPVHSTTHWHCEVCDKEIRRNSRLNHLLSVKHRKKLNDKNSGLNPE